MDLTKLPKDDDDAKARADRFESLDPFPGVPRALLSSFEIADYARVTGMMWPFAEKQLKSASYEVFIGGEVIWWDGKGRRQSKIVKRGTPLILEANSIVFAQVEPVFRLPNYIAIRFNLRITHVHRGLLLGTGPLVDPGFHGKLLIPLHNLTSTNYAIDTNEALIWIEFTKTTFGYVPAIEEDLATPRDPNKFKGFPPDKRHLDPDKYLRKANAGNAIQSSIPDSIAKSADSAREAAKSLSRIRNIGILAALGIVLTIGFALYQIGQQFGSMVQNSQSLIASLSTDAKGMAEKITTLSTENRSLTDKLVELKDANERLNERMNEQNAQIEKLNSPPRKQAKKRASSTRKGP
ncbi:MAG: dCTP deaminase domain-containing protein [Bradyrhizobium sp.]|uniref:dCTP deaminase domain-containing protein n=1 Tax=Bradyrhizobium sp. TaxID=376 RepID=UPI00348801E0